MSCALTFHVACNDWQDRLAEWLLFCRHMGAHTVFLYVIDSPSYPLSPLSRALFHHLMQQHQHSVRVVLWNIPLAEGTVCWQGSGVSFKAP